MAIPILTEVERSRDRWLDGECYDFAKTLRSVTGWKPVGFAVDGSVWHVALQAAPGKYVDAAGYVTVADMNRRYGLPEGDVVMKVQDLAVSELNATRTPVKIWHDALVDIRTYASQGDVAFVEALKNHSWCRPANRTHYIVASPSGNPDLAEVIEIRDNRERVRAGEWPSVLFAGSLAECLEFGMGTDLDCVGQPTLYDREIERSRWLNGGCLEFAKVLQPMTGWPAAGIEIHGSLVHVGLRHPTGGFVDACGIVEIEEMRSRYELTHDDQSLRIVEMDIEFLQRNKPYPEVREEVLSAIRTFADRGEPIFREAMEIERSRDVGALTQAI